MYAARLLPIALFLAATTAAPWSILIIDDNDDDTPLALSEANPNSESWGGGK
jgi:hypothetical protein